MVVMAVSAVRRGIYGEVGLARWQGFFKASNALAKSAYFTGLLA
jgi:hypothetical protein